MKRKWDVIAVFLFAAVVCAVYLPVFTCGFFAVNSSDGLHLHMPRAVSLLTIVGRGNLPSWNPFVNLGQPYADGIGLIFHPAHALYVLLPPWLSHTVAIITGLFLIFLGMYALLMHMGLGSAASIAGALCYGFSGPVFFQHSYHLGFMAVLLIPWGILFFHAHDSGGRRLYAVLSAAACVLLVHSCDGDAALYVLGLFAADRWLRRPRSGKRRYVSLWGCIGILSILSGAFVYAPFIEWAGLSSRPYHSYESTLFPGAANLLYAVWSGSWIRDYPYDPSYFYLGPGIIALASFGMRRIWQDGYSRRIFMFSLLAPVVFIACWTLNALGICRQISIDPWKMMIVFCFSLSIAAAQGTRVILASPLAVWLRGLAVVSAVIYSAMPAFARTAIRPSCGWNFTVENLTDRPALMQCPGMMRNIPYYARLASVAGPARSVLFGGTDNMTEMAGLRTLINYAPIYNLEFERALCSDGLIADNRAQPFWMTLDHPDAGRLAVYGVRFLVCLGGAVNDMRGVPAWVRRHDLSWADHYVFENRAYRGRAYLVDRSGAYCGPAEILFDSANEVVIAAHADSPARLVLADLAYPGWQASLDGSRVEVSVFNGCLRSVDIPSGSHRLVWRYSSALLLRGAVVSAVSAILLAAVVIIL